MNFAFILKYPAMILRYQSTYSLPGADFVSVFITWDGQHCQAHTAIPERRPSNHRAKRFRLWLLWQGLAQDSEYNAVHLIFNVIQQWLSLYLILYHNIPCHTQIMDTLAKHGIPLGVSANEIHLATEWVKMNAQQYVLSCSIVTYLHVIASAILRK